MATGKRFDTKEAKEMKEEHGGNAELLTQTMVGSPAYCASVSHQDAKNSPRPLTDQALFCAQAPEIKRMEPYGVKVDQFSFGMMLQVCLPEKHSHSCSPAHLFFFADRFEIAHRRDCGPSFFIEQIRCQRTALMTGWRPEPSPSVAKSQPALMDLMRECWAEDSKVRPAFTDILSRLETAIAVA